MAEIRSAATRGLRTWARARQLKMLPVRWLDRRGLSGISASPLQSFFRRREAPWNLLSSGIAMSSIKTLGLRVVAASVASFSLYAEPTVQNGSDARVQRCYCLDLSSMRLWHFTGGLSVGGLAAACFLS